jgi:hypothetical protein
MWEIVGAVLKLIVPAESRMQALQEAASRSCCNDVIDFILPVCADDQLEFILETLLSREVWEAVGRVLERGVSTSWHKTTVEKAIRLATVEDLLQFILPHCTESILTQEVAWATEMLNVLLTKVSVNDDKQTVQICVAIFLPYCSQDQREKMLVQLLSKHVWPAVGDVLEAGVSESLQRSALENALEHADVDDLTEAILPRCSSDLLYSFLPVLVQKKLWAYVYKAFEATSIDDSIKKTIEEIACKRECRFEEMLCDAGSIFNREDIRNLCDHNDCLDILVAILPHCTEDLLSLLPPLVAEIMSNVSSIQHARVNTMLNARGLLYVNHEQLCRVLPYLLCCSHYRYVEYLLIKGACDDRDVAAAIVEACSNKQTQSLFIPIN